MFNLKDRKVIVTGATGGIGEAIAHTLHSAGAQILLHGTRVDKLEALSQQLPGSKFLAANLMDREAVKEFGVKAEEMLGGVDILVNNAGITRDGLFVRMKDQDWDDVILVNLTSIFTLSKAVVPSMMKQRFGRIINISSVVGVSGNPGQTNYCATKAGIIGFSKSLAQELAGRQITVNCVAPGFISSPMTDELNEKQRNMILDNIPQKRMGSADDIAAAVMYLASDEAGYVTGQTLHVNGGMLMV